MLRPQPCRYRSLLFPYTRSLPSLGPPATLHHHARDKLRPSLPLNRRAHTSAAAESNAYQNAIQQNKEWAANLNTTKPDFLPNLSKGQAPKILWIGCSDSRVPAEIITGLDPGDVFVHRNIANILNPTDLSSISVIEFACRYLKVQHVVVCGHSSCGGVNAALGNSKLGKIDTWLTSLRRLRMQHFEELEALPDNAARTKLLVDLNVKQGVATLLENPDIVEAQQDRGLTVHGVVFDLATGELTEIATPEPDATARKGAFVLT